MMNLNDLYREYDALLVGNRKNISKRFFSQSQKKNMECAVAIMRYAFQTYLRWSPETLSERLDKKTMGKLKLIPLMKYVEYPIEYSKSRDWYYLVSLAYGRMRLDLRAKTIHTYECVLAGDKAKYPKDYFVGNDGVVRAGICLQHALSNHAIWHDVNDLYAMFASEEGYELLRDYKLLQACKDIFETPVDYVNFIIPREERDPFLLHYYRFKYVNEMLNENGRKKKATSDYKLEVK